MASRIGMSYFEVWGGNEHTDVNLTLPGMEAWVLCRPHGSTSYGGDVHYFSSCGTGRITRLMLVDVMGHGEEAAGIARFLWGLMRRYLNHIEPYKIAAEMNQGLHDHQQGMGRFATAVIMTYFAPIGELTLCNAGHPPPMIYRRGCRSWTVMNSYRSDEGTINLPLGILEESGYAGWQMTLEPNDHVLIYTDGLIEARNRDGKMLGTENLRQFLNDVGDPERSKEPQELAHGLMRQFEAHGYHADDDLSVILLRCTQRVAGAGAIGRVKGIWRGLCSLLGNQGVPWPEMSVRNLLGGMLPPFNRYRPRYHREK